MNKKKKKRKTYKEMKLKPENCRNNQIHKYRMVMTSYTAGMNSKPPGVNKLQERGQHPTQKFKQEYKL